MRALLGGCISVLASSAPIEFNATSRRVCTDVELSSIRKERVSRELKFILNALKGPRCGGFFIESGANNGRNSITRDFEIAAGWRGMCIEASPRLFSLLERWRPKCSNHNVAIFGERKELIFREFADSVLMHCRR